MAKPPAPFMKIDRTHSKIEDSSAVLRVKTFRRGFEAGELDDITGVTVRELREISSTQFGVVFEYDITIQGDESRRRIVENAITQTLNGNAAGRRMLVILANRMLSE